MSLNKQTKEQLKEAYRNFEPYLNDKSECQELHEMCKCCEKFCGIKKHDYKECKNLPCFRNWLGLAYLDWTNGY